MPTRTIGAAHAQEHPLLHVPVYCLHPCGTPQLMQLAAADAAPDRPATNPIVTWLSFVGPQVGIKVPLAYIAASAAAPAAR